MVRIRCNRPVLANAFQIVDAVVPSRTPKEILRNVLLSVEEGKVTLIGTDQEIGIRYDLPGVEVASSGTSLLPSKRVLSILRELTDDFVEIEITEEAAWIRSDSSEFRLSAQDPTEFPPVAGFNEDKYYVMMGGALKSAIRRTIFATDIESTRYALGGVMMELKSDKVNLVATDSRRLALVESVCRTEGIEEGADVNPVIPRQAMALIEKSITDDQEDVLIAVHTNDVVVKCGNSTLYSRLVDGRFPQYSAVIPQQTSISVDLVAGPFHSAVRQAQIVTDEDSRGVDFVLTNGQLTLNSQSADIGKSEIHLPVSYEGDEIIITFDPRFVAEFLRVLDPEQQVQFLLNDGEQAAVLKTEDNYTYVIMPLSRDH